MAYFGDGGSKDNYFVKLAHALHELVHARPLDDVHIVVVALDFHRYRKISLMQYLALLAWAYPTAEGYVLP